MKTTPLPATATDQDLEPGTTVGEYVVDRKLGQGGFGAVFEAHHPVIEKVVAIKVLSRRYSVEPEVTARFVAEAKAVNKIRHRNIIDIFSFGQLEDGRHYYVMEHLDGETLDDLLERQGRLSLAEALPILRGVARALDAAHTKSVAHRDLKPGNIFISRDEEGAVFPKLLDFGIAKLMHVEPAEQGHSTRTGIPMGTPLYMSPEQCRGRDVDHRTDYYAFGVLMYLMLTGSFPIEGEDYMTILMRQINDEPAPPSSLVPELLPVIDSVVAWLMQKEASRRPPNLATAIQALTAGRIPTAPLTLMPTPVPGILSSAAIPPDATAPREVTPAAIAPITASPTSTGSSIALEQPRWGLRIGLGLTAVLAVGAIVFVVVKSRSETAAPDPTAPTAPATAPPPVARPEPTPIPPPAKPAPAEPPAPVVAPPVAKQPPARPTDKPPIAKKAPANAGKRTAGSATPPSPPAGSAASDTTKDSHGIEDPFKK